MRWPFETGASTESAPRRHTQYNVQCAHHRGDIAPDPLLQHNHLKMLR